MNEMDLLTDMLTAVPAPQPPQPAQPARARAALDAAIVAEHSGRHSRRLPRGRLAIAGGVAAAAASVLTAYELQPASSHANPPANVRLAAWTVTTTHKHVLKVTIRKLRDPAGLERLLRRHGVPTRAHFQTSDFTPTTSTTAVPRGCHAPKLSDRALSIIEGRVFPPPLPSQESGVSETSKAQEQLVLLIKPAALPPGMGVYIKAAISKKEYNGIPQYLSIQADLVQATKACTG